MYIYALKQVQIVVDNALILVYNHNQKGGGNRGQVKADKVAPDPNGSRSYGYRVRGEGTARSKAK